MVTFCPIRGRFDLGMFWLVHTEVSICTPISIYRNQLRLVAKRVIICLIDTHISSTYSSIEVCIEGRFHMSMPKN